MSSTEEYQQQQFWQRHSLPINLQPVSPSLEYMEHVEELWKRAWSEIGIPANLLQNKNEK